MIYKEARRILHSDTTATMVGFQNMMLDWKW